MKLEALKRKLYDSKLTFKNFNNITSEKIKEMRDIINKFKIRFEKDTLTNNLLNIKLQFYENVLKYITHPNSSSIFKSFDEKILFLILATDQDCEMFRTYLATNGGTKNHDPNTPDWKNIVREKIGFYDQDLLPYEKVFYLKYNIVTDVKADYTTLIIISGKNIKSFENITNERYNDLTNLLKLWKDIAGKELNHKAYAYNILYSKLSIDEKIILFIKAVDPNLKLLQIYNDECNINNMEFRSFKEFGFYSEHIFKLEQLYYERFGNNLEINKWQKTIK